MKYRLRNTLLWQLTIGQIIALILLTIYAVLRVTLSCDRASDRTEQMLNWNSAKQLIPTIERILTRDYTYWELQRILQDKLSFNPGADIYILDSSGRIAADSGGLVNLRKKKIDLNIILDFIKTNAAEGSPIYGLDPRDKAKTVSVFSAARFFARDETYYIYIILKNKYHYNIDNNAKVQEVLAIIPEAGLTYIIIGLILAGIFYYLFTNRLSRVSAVLAEFREGNFSRRIPAHGVSDEIGYLMETINSMADAIDDKVSQLQHKDTLRRELIGNIAHDLRSPVALISGLSEVMLLEDKMSSSAREKCELVGDSCKALNKLLSELFELAKFEAKESKPEMMIFSTSELLDDMLRVYQPLVQKRGIQLLKIEEGNIPDVYGDPGMIARVLTNLIDNSLRYTPEKGTITLGLSKTEKVQVSVSDTGKGIPSEELPYVFERLYQVKQTPGVDNGLSGLGLAIVKKIVEAHGSEIKVRSTAGEGTTFSFELQVVA